MESTKGDRFLLGPGFAPEQIKRLHQLRHTYASQKQVQMIEERRRLEFARWLIATGHLSDTFPVPTML
ncbi:MAG TPA: hypothetical protein VFN35_20955 [Ktedonobacteraceae bacterium]|nr:hypothetical protein [Ktedonobacteraceae bacterium]